MKKITITVIATAFALGACLYPDRPRYRRDNLYQNHPAIPKPPRGPGMSRLMLKLARAALPDGRSCGALDPVKLALLAVLDESLPENGELPAGLDAGRSLSRPRTFRLLSSTGPFRRPASASRRGRPAGCCCSWMWRRSPWLLRRCPVGVLDRKPQCRQPRSSTDGRPDAARRSGSPQGPVPGDQIPCTHRIWPASAP